MLKKRKPNPITPTAGRPAAPKQLDGEALDEWTRVCDELDQMGTLVTADRSIIAIYVKAWERWMKAEGRIAQSGEIVGSPKTGVPMQNPWVSVAARAHDQAVKLLGELGLTPRSRSIIAKNAAAAGQEEEEEQDDFADLE